MNKQELLDYVNYLICHRAEEGDGFTNMYHKGFSSGFIFALEIVNECISTGKIPKKKSPTVRSSFLNIPEDEDDKRK